MNDVVKLRMTPEIEEEAATWVWRLEDENVSAADRTAFEHWLKRDAHHRRAFEDLGGVWRSLDGLAEAKREEKIATFTQLPHSASYPLSRFRQRTGVRRFLRALAAAVLIAIGAVLWLQRGNEVQTLSTAVGQQRTVILADGSTVHLNTNTILETRLDRNRRTLRLLKGEALFTVAHDARRPFIVHAGDAVVRALGTEFNVRLREAHGIEVIVSEGRVEVQAQPGAVKLSAGSAPAAKHASIKRALSAGQKFDTASAAAPVEPIDTQSLSNALAWRDGAMVFDGEPLSDAIAELNRYTDTRFVVTDAGIRDLRVGGRFKAGDAAEFLAAMEEALPVSARRASDNLVYIEPRQPK